MLPESTTTIGEGESLMIEMPFQSMNAVERTRAKFRTWVANCRGWRLESAEIIVFYLRFVAVSGFRCQGW